MIPPPKVSVLGLEPATSPFSARFSTTELHSLTNPWRSRVSQPFRRSYPLTQCPVWATGDKVCHKTQNKVMFTLLYHDPKPQNLRGVYQKMSTREKHPKIDQVLLCYQVKPSNLPLNSVYTWKLSKTCQAQA